MTLTRKILLILLAATVLAAGVELAQRNWLAGARPRAAGGPLPDAPQVTLKDLDGNDVSLEQFRGTVVLVNFWATWCGPCQIEMPWFIEFQEKYGSRGFTVLGIAMDEEDKSMVESFVRDRQFDLEGRKAKVNYPIVLGSDAVAEKFGGLIGLPTTLVISRDGKIAKRFIGLVNHELIVKEIEEQLQK